MTDKNRNFRSSYYDKVGFRGVEEKKSLEILINEKPMDRLKLSKFCMRFTLPSIYRELVWKVLLDVISINSETHEYIAEKNKEHYAFMEESLKVMGKIDETTPKNVIHTLMYLMTEDILLFDQQEQLDSLENKNLISIASVFLKLCSCEVTSYWLFKKFIFHQKSFNVGSTLLLAKDLNPCQVSFNSIQPVLHGTWTKSYYTFAHIFKSNHNLEMINANYFKFAKDLNCCQVSLNSIEPILPDNQTEKSIHTENILKKEQLETILKKEDNQLYEHLQSVNALEVLPVDLWFERYFSEVLHYTSLARIFDKLIGGNYKILPYIGAALLMIIRRSLLDLNSSDEIVQELEKIPKDTSDVIVNKAFDLYYS